MPTITVKFHIILFFLFIFFFFNDTATTEIYTLSLHDALPFPRARHTPPPRPALSSPAVSSGDSPAAVSPRDRKSTRLNSSHVESSYAVFCLKKKKKTKKYFCFEKKKNKIKT